MEALSRVHVVDHDSVDRARGRLFVRLCELDEAAVLILQAHADALSANGSPMARVMALAAALEALASTANAEASAAMAMPHAAFEALLAAPVEARPHSIVAADVAALSHEAAVFLRRSLAAAGYRA